MECIRERLHTLTQEQSAKNSWQSLETPSPGWLRAPAFRTVPHHLPYIEAIWQVSSGGESKTYWQSHFRLVLGKSEIRQNSEEGEGLNYNKVMQDFQHPLFKGFKHVGQYVTKLHPILFLLFIPLLPLLLIPVLLALLPLLLEASFVLFPLALLVFLFHSTRFVTILSQIPQFILQGWHNLIKNVS